MDETKIKAEMVEVELGDFSTINFTDIQVNGPPAPKPSCETCRFWAPLSSWSSRKYDQELGYCRRFPPVGVAKPGDSSPYPSTYGASWCGEYEGATA